MDKEGIPLTSVFHKACGRKELVDFGGYVWCNHCDGIVRDEDIIEVEDEKNKERNK